MTFNSGKSSSSPEKAAVKFVASEYLNSYAMLHRSQRNTEGADKSYLGSKLRVRWSTDPTKLEGLDEDSLYYIQLADPDFPIGLAGFDEDGYSDPAMLNCFTENGSEVTLYYQFFDEVKLSESPVYGIRLRRDDIPPVIALSVSETDEQVQQVQVKVDSVYDIHPVTEGGTTRYVIDTPTEEIEFFAESWRKVNPGESFNTTDKEREDYLDPIYDFMTEDGCEYVRVYPDRNGVFLFTSNGHIMLNANDSAGNYSQSLLVNGEALSYNTFVGEGLIYTITNLIASAGVYDRSLVWTQTDSEGKIQHIGPGGTALATNAYLAF